MDQILMVAATLVFLPGVLHTFVTLRGRNDRASWLAYALVAVGFVVQTAFLVHRGHLHGRCPVTNGFEIIMFLCWSMALFYLVVGSGFRMSVLGVFTAPVIVLMQSAAMVFGNTTPPATRAGTGGFWVELHAALSIMAFGAFGLAAIAGAVFLLQEKQLRSRRPDQSFFRLPPIVDLGRLNTRLMLAGFLFLTVGLVAGFVTGEVTAWVKFLSGGIVWLIYAIILQMGLLRHLPPRRGAVLSLGAFCLSFFTLIGMEHLTRTVT